MYEIDFQALFNLYHSHSLLNKKRALEDLHRYIYNYGIRRFRSSREISSEFYVHAFDKIEIWLQEYDPSYNISFQIFLHFRLKNLYYNFIQKKKDREIEENRHEFHEINSNAVYKPLFGFTDPGEPKFLLERKERIEKALHVLNQDEQTAVRLYFGFGLLLRHFRYIRKKYPNHNLIESYRFYQVCLELHNEKQKNDKEKTFMKLVKIDTRRRQNRIKSFHTKQERLLQQFYRLEKGVKLKYVAIVMNENLTFVHRRIKSGKKKILEHLGKDLYFVRFKTQKSA